MTQKPSIYLSPSFTRFNPRHMAFSTWAHHMAFGYDIIAAVRPSLLVELGAYNGLSFFCFCQSMAEHEVDGVCYAVDTWQGDDHTGAYGEEIYKAVLKHSREFYASFTYLMRMRFNEALCHFNDNTIDLLHIDGLHTYEAVREDYENWFPKVKPGGVILFHDIFARLKDFGVWKFWQEIAPNHESFEFKHGFGLGVIRKAGGPARQEPLFDLLFSSSADEQSKLRAYYVQIAQYLGLKGKFLRQEQRNPAPPSEEPAQGKLKAMVDALAAGRS